MKTRQSGMPDVTYWESLFDVPLIINKMEIKKDIEKLLDVGCGYGTFSIAASKVIDGHVMGIDLESDLIDLLNSHQMPGDRLNFSRCDFLSDGLPSCQFDYIMLFNILHMENPNILIQLSKKCLSKFGRIGAIHWNYDEKTPRGPSMDIRLRPDEMAEILKANELNISQKIDLPPYHYGFIASIQ